MQPLLFTKFEINRVDFDAEFWSEVIVPSFTVQSTTPDITLIFDIRVPQGAWLSAYWRNLVPTVIHRTPLSIGARLLRKYARNDCSTPVCYYECELTGICSLEGLYSEFPLGDLTLETQNGAQSAAAKRRRFSDHGVNPTIDGDRAELRDTVKRSRRCDDPSEHPQHESSRFE
uniref:p17 nucleocytoplasmic shuttling suppressor protein n=1 Tax=Corvid orthoreovirus TaxID=2737667 RepID=A0A6M5XPW2_9REOV|nr:p17 nucleocytoplasmic shuttling suppressor protein [Corvid orthoreovirus]